MNRDVVKLFSHDDNTLRKGQGDKRPTFLCLWHTSPYSGVSGNRIFLIWPISV